MIVTCESCKSRYKLDDAKITGRGAKITCPKCRNVFVVYAQPDPSSADTPPLSAPPRGSPVAPQAGGPPPWEPPGSSKRAGGLADAVKAADRSIVPGTPDNPGRIVAGSSSAGPRTPTERPGTQPPTPAPSAWDDEPTRIGGGNPTPDEISQEVARLAAASASAASGGAVKAGGDTKDPAAMAARAASLDFRKVGVTTWKVKVKIGLIYDFSDIKTLRKYIQDGRVTAADVVSWDGKAWRAIGDIPDLDAFFVEAWDTLAARKSETPTLNPVAPVVDAPRAEETPAGPVTPPPLRNGGEPDRFQDPFADLKKKQQRDRSDNRRSGPVVTPPASKKAESSAPQSRLPLVLAVLVGVLLLAGGAAWWTNQPTVTPVTTARPKPAGSGKSADQIRDEINEKLKASLEGSPAPDEVVTSPPDEPEREALVPVGRPPNGIPEGAVPVRNPRGAAPSGSNLKQADQTAADHEAVGDDAAGSGDWATASQAYKKAAALDARSSRLSGKLGRALYEAGDYTSAQPVLDRAAKAGTKDAYKYLGHIARLQGDTALANSQYQLYLKGAPSDAAQIEQIIAQMSGG